MECIECWVWINSFFANQYGITPDARKDIGVEVPKSVYESLFNLSGYLSDQFCVKNKEVK